MQPDFFFFFFPEAVKNKTTITQANKIVHQEYVDSVIGFVLQLYFQKNNKKFEKKML